MEQDSTNIFFKKGTYKFHNRYILSLDAGNFLQSLKIKAKNVDSIQILRFGWNKTKFWIYDREKRR